MGAVYSAIDRANGRRVALKRLAQHAAPRMAALFEREFYVLSSLRHPRIIEVYDFGVDADGPYYTMELLEGSDLRDLSPLPAGDACLYLRDVASSLALLHARRLLHRDVSPRNVRTLPHRRCKLIDFGALASFGTSEELVGTPPAIPPEALSAEPLDQRADLFSLGALAYYILTGRHAYQARKVGELPDAWRDKPLPPSRYAEGVPPELDELVLALLSLDPLARPGSAAEVIDRLEAIAELAPDRDEQVARAYFVGAALVERGRELARVERKLARAKTGRGDAIFVDGKPGTGKTRFVTEVALRAQLVGTVVLRADAAAHTGAFSTARAIVQQLVRVAPRLARKALAEHLDSIQGAWPDVIAALDLPAESPARSREPDAMRASLPDALARCMRTVASHCEVLVAVDDVDRADMESVAFLLSLARASRSQKLVMLTTACAKPPAELSPAVRALRDAGASIRLRELGSEGVAQLVNSAFGDAPHARRTAMRLFNATGGNPGRAMRALQRLVDEGTIRYVAGAWSLPLEIPAERFEQTDVASENLGRCSAESRRLAALLAIRDEPAPLEWFVAFEKAGSRSSRDVIAALEELVSCAVLVSGAEGYWFAGSCERSAALRDVGEMETARLRVRMGEALLASAPDAALRIKAGMHLIRGGEELRGADLIARAARSILSEDSEAARTLARASAALEAALDVYRRHERSSLAKLGLLVPLVVASYEASPLLATRYGEETIVRLERALGLPPSSEGACPTDLEELRRVLSSAPVLEPGESRTEETPDVAQLVAWLVGAAISLTAVASTIIDHAAEGRYVAALRPFTVLGPAHPACLAHDFCRLLQMMAEDRLAETHAGWTRLLSRLNDATLPPALRHRLRRGATYALGVLECQRDDSAVLARVRALEEIDGPDKAAFAEQLRFLYQGFRGDMELAQRHRDRVEEYAVQHGSAWQVEIWSTSTANAVYGNTRDIAGNKRAVEQLERLKKTHPSLTRFWERAVASHHVLTGATERGIEQFERMQSPSDARNHVGWSSVQGWLARAYNDVGRYEDAKRVCDETLPLCSADFDFISLTLGCRIELCRALAGLGEAPAAKAHLAQLLDRHLPNENPATLTSIYRTLAQVALFEKDMDAFEQHLASMRRWAQPTKNPALIGQCDQLRSAVHATGTWTATQPVTGALSTTMQTFVQSVFATCDGEASRRSRALELVATQSGAKQAWLFTNDENELVVAGRLGTIETPDELRSLVQAFFAKPEVASDDTALVENAAQTPMESVRAVPGSYRLLPLTVRRGEKRVLVGALALPVDGMTRPVSYALLEDIAAQLFLAGDVGTVRTFC
jgi:hypothetical protein